MDTPTSSGRPKLDSDTRAGEIMTPLPDHMDAEVLFIGRVRTPWTDRADCPRQGRDDGPECKLEIDERWRDGLRGLEAYSRLDVLYWMDRSRRDLVVQNPAKDGRLVGTFVLRSPVRPNPIALSNVALVRVEMDGVVVRGMDCLDGTPLLDIKPNRCEFSPKAVPKPDRPV